MSIGAAQILKPAQKGDGVAMTTVAAEPTIIRLNRKAVRFSRPVRAMAAFRAGPVPLGADFAHLNMFLNKLKQSHAITPIP